MRKLLAFAAIVVTLLIPGNCLAKARFVVKDKVIVDTERKVWWTRNANLTVKHVSHNDALDYVRKLSSMNYGGCNNWELPSGYDFDASFDYRRYRPNMGAYNHKKYRKIGFAGVKDFYYHTTDTKTYTIGNATFPEMVNPVSVGVSDSDLGYLWPICRQ